MIMVQRIKLLSRIITTSLLANHSHGIYSNWKTLSYFLNVPIDFIPNGSANDDCASSTLSRSTSVLSLTNRPHLITTCVRRKSRHKRNVRVKHLPSPAVTQPTTETTVTKPTRIQPNDLTVKINDVVVINNHDYGSEMSWSAPSSPHLIDTYELLAPPSLPPAIGTVKINGQSVRRVANGRSAINNNHRSPGRSANNPALSASQLAVKLDAVSINRGTISNNRCLSSTRNNTLNRTPSQQSRSNHPFALPNDSSIKSRPPSCFGTFGARPSRLLVGKNSIQPMTSPDNHPAAISTNSPKEFDQTGSRKSRSSGRLFNTLNAAFNCTHIQAAPESQETLIIPTATKPPTGILRNSTANRTTSTIGGSKNLTNGSTTQLINGDPTGRSKRSGSVGGKTVKIVVDAPVNGNHHQPTMTLSERIRNGSRLTQFHDDGRPRQQLHGLLKRKLASESIDLTEPPYSDARGFFGIPLRLIQRYAMELDADLFDVAVVLEIERELRLADLKRPIVSFMAQIHSRHFLNCEGIKTGSMQDFLTAIGLPMYIGCVEQQPQQVSPSLPSSSSSSARPTATSATRPSAQGHRLTPADLAQLTDLELVGAYNFTPSHAAWLRREVSVFPWTLLAQSCSIESRNYRRMHSLPKRNGSSGTRNHRQQRSKRRHSKRSSSIDLDSDYDFLRFRRRLEEIKASSTSRCRTIARSQNI